MSGTSNRPYGHRQVWTDMPRSSPLTIEEIVTVSTAPTADSTPNPTPAPQPAPAPESPAAPESTAPESTQTLHDFVVNLLTDAGLRSAFELDPEGTLARLGLSDVVPADVHDVIPLVVDSVPLQGLTDLSAVEGLGALGVGSTGVVGQVQTVANQFTAGVNGTGADVTVANVAAVSVDPDGLTVSASSGLPVLGLGGGATVDLSGAQDVADTLDANVLGTAGGLGAVDGVLGTADVAATTLTSTAGTATDLIGAGDLGGLTDLTGTLGNPTDLSGALGAATGTVDGALAGVGDLDGTLDRTLDGVTGTVGGVADLDGTLATVTGTVGGAAGVTDLAGVTDTVSGVADLGGTVGTVTGTVDGALGGVTGLGGTGDLGVQGLTDGVL
jgi:hypothetical protein